ncbi:MAG: pyrroline-5-carboxylate reductase [Planctomycetes bacterium]|nr:pyrroline-5-carboxylate reductase [Planctomycetota bacterium]
MGLLEGKRIGFFGAGNMAEALARGLVSSGIPAERLFASDLAEARRKFFTDELSIAVTNDNREVLAGCEVVIFAVKPQNMPGLLAIISPAPAGKLLISICAGVTTGFIEKQLSGTPHVVRAMPNMPMLVQAGVAALAKGRWATDEDLAVAKEIFQAAATVVEVDESAMDAVTAVSGSGPAYFFYLVEALAEAGVKLGLPEDAALRLASRTCLGAGRLLAESPDPPAELRRKVTSPGGTTFAAVRTMEKAALKETVIKAVEAAAARSKELGL